MSSGGPYLITNYGYQDPLMSTAPTSNLSEYVLAQENRARQQARNERRMMKEKSRFFQNYKSQKMNSSIHNSFFIPLATKTFVRNLTKCALRQKWQREHVMFMVGSTRYVVDKDGIITWN